MLLSLLLREIMEMIFIVEILNLTPGSGVLSTWGGV